MMLQARTKVTVCILISYHTMLTIPFTGGCSNTMISMLSMFLWGNNKLHKVYNFINFLRKIKFTKSFSLSQDMGFSSFGKFLQMLHVKIAYL